MRSEAIWGDLPEDHRQCRRRQHTIHDLHPNSCCNLLCLKPLAPGHRYVYVTSAHIYMACSPECITIGGEEWNRFIYYGGGFSNLAQYIKTRQWEMANA